jgi:DNA modification methylase
MAACWRRANWRWAEVPVIVARGWSEAQRRAYIIADNKIALNAGWDEALLRLELADLNDMAFDLSLIGFGEAEQADLLRRGGLTDPDEAPPLAEVPVSRPDDLWVCGRHRVLCGNATSGGDVARLLGGAKPLLMVTDPPYGVDYDPAWRQEAARKGLLGFHHPSARALGTINNDGQSDWKTAWTLFPGDVAYVWHADLFASIVQTSLEMAGFEIRCEIIWAKSSFAISRGHYNWQHEPCWYAVRKGKTGHWVGDRSQTTLWPISHMKSETGHSAQKPEQCMRQPIENNSRPGEAVYDPFLGSGTTIIAAEMTGRACLALEIAPAYVDVAVKRWQAFTGEKAVLDGNGRTFEEVAAERTPKAA